MERWRFAFQQEPPGALLVGHGAALPSSAQHRLPLCLFAKSEQGNNLLWASRADGSPLRITIPFVCVCVCTRSLRCTVGAWLSRLSPAVPLWMIQIQGQHSALTAELAEGANRGHCCCAARGGIGHQTVVFRGFMGSSVHAVALHKITIFFAIYIRIYLSFFSCSFFNLI